MPFVETRAGTLCYQDHGDGPLIVLLHATLHDHHDFDALVERLEPDYRLVTLDWPGCGLSAPATEPAKLSATLFADALEDLVDHLAVPSLCIVGNSVGGFAAARLALTRPQQVAGLVLVDTGGFIPMTTPTRLFCKAMGTPWITRLALPTFARLYMKPTSSLDHEILERVVSRARTSAGVQQAAALWRSFARDDSDLRSRAAQLVTPTLIVWGLRDRAIPVSAGRATHAVIPNSRFEVLDTGHVPFASAPEEFLALAEPFLRSVT
ncbi:alpha/beta fold hydrolase [Mycobacterium sp. NBC_00419]|uniref:alpha/beta fold hydrolase n=1 Tax=Mycobacterium sp. NBC_00419 TaxID=2975989 RepID=UPI002E217041